MVYELGSVQVSPASHQCQSVLQWSSWKRRLFGMELKMADELKLQERSPAPGSSPGSPPRTTEAAECPVQKGRVWTPRSEPKGEEEGGILLQETRKREAPPRGS